MKRLSVILVFALSGFPAAFAATVAVDAASNSVYNSGWTAGLNGGSGFGAWTLSPQPNGSAGFFVGDSTLNGTFPSGGINTGGRAFGLYGNGAAADGWRALQGGALSVDQSFRIDFDNGWLNAGTSVGFGLQNSVSQNLFEVWFNGGDAFYTINDFSGVHATTNGWTDGGLRLQLRLNSTTNYSLSVIQGTATNTYTGFLMSQANQGIQQFHLWNGGVGSGQNYDFYVNSMSVVPEPGTMALMGLALAGMTVFYRHVRRRRNI
jgi:hypothetical protein